MVLVVFHHSVLAYCTFGHVDRLHYALSTAPIVDGQRWAGFNVAVRLNDGFFMPLLFLLSGLFVPDGLARKGRGGFLRDRLLRLGLPFIVAELTLVPLAYYPSFLQAGGSAGWGPFWLRTVTAGPWPSGPPWFVFVLLVFDVAAVLAHVARPGFWARREVPSPGRCFAALLLGSILVYLPVLARFGPGAWVGFGPLAVQGSRVLLYGGTFAAGAWLGTAGMPGLRRFGDVLAVEWAGWAGLALLCGAAFTVFGGLGRLATGMLLVAWCAAACFALAAAFLRFGGRPGPVWGSLAANGFAIYLLHYPVVTWIQFLLLPVPAGAVGKGLGTFALALGLSWAAAAGLRRFPGMARAL